MFRPYAKLVRTSAAIEASLSTNAFRYFFLVMYATSVLLMAIWGFRSQFVATPDRTMRWFISIARGAGYALNFNTALVILLVSRLFLTVLRNTPISRVLPLDSAFPDIHILVAYVTMAAVAIHVPFHFTWIIGWNGWSPGLWHVNMTVITGVLLLVDFIVLAVFARPYFRKSKFKIFYRVHLVAAFLFFVLLILHGMYNDRPETYKYVAGPLVIYILDRVVRRLRMSTNHLELSAEHSVFIREDILHLRIPKPFSYRPGQYAEIMVPSINHEWHPFTIASAEFEGTMSFYIKSLGDWTKSLHSAFHSRCSGEEKTSLPIRVRGPFGAPAQHVESYKRVFLISGGIGATPFASICKQVQHNHSLHNHAPTNHASPTGNLPPKSDEVELRIQQNLLDLYGVDVQLGLNGSPSEVNANENKDTVPSQSDAADAFEHLLHKENNAGSPVGTSDFVAIDLSPKPKELDSENSPSPPTLDVNAPTREGARPLRSPTSPHSPLSPTALGRLFSQKSPRFTRTGRTSSAVVNPAISVRQGENRYTLFKPKSTMGHHTNWEVQPVSLTPMDSKQRARRQNKKERRTELLSFLHSSRVSFALCILAIARIAVVICASIFKSDFVLLAFEGPQDAGGIWLPIVYTILSIPFAVLLPLIVVLETSILRSTLLASTRHLSEGLVFGPVAIAAVVLEIRKLVTRSPGGEAATLAQYLVMQGATFAVLSLRLWRSVGLVGLTEKKCDCLVTTCTPEVNFVWTTPLPADDKWLRNELKGVTAGGAVRVQRYVTRGEVGDASGRKDEFQSMSYKGRPNWEQVLSSTARQSASGSVIGIFFCGPKKMGQAVQDAARNIEIWSSIREIYLRTTTDQVLMEGLGLVSQEEIQSVRKRGCSVRFVFREEKFS